MSHQTFLYSVLKQGPDVAFHSFLLKPYGGIDKLKNAKQNMTQQDHSTFANIKQFNTCGQPLQSVVDSMSRLLCAAVILLHLNRLNFPILLQIKGLEVPREKRDDVGWGGHCMGNVCKACEQNNKFTRDGSE